MRLKKEIANKVADIQSDRDAFDISYLSMKCAMYKNLSSPLSLLLGFSGGFMVGWRRPGDKSQAKTPKAKKQKSDYHARQVLRTIPWPYIISLLSSRLMAQRPQPPGESMAEMQ